jgi:D-sedoheptulose 7-phosphate isomerase
MMRDFIFDYFKEASNLIIESSDRLGEPISDAILMMTNALRSGNKILSCGNGGSASDAQHFAAELMGRFEVERGPLSAIALTTDTSFLTAVANDYDFDQVFTRQVKGLGRPGDVLLAISTSGNSRNVLLAVDTARQLRMSVVMLTGAGGGELGRLIKPSDCLIQVPHLRTSHVQEVHGLIIHCLCQGIDQELADHASGS